MIAYLVQSVPARRALRERLLLDLPSDTIVVEDEGFPPNPWRGYKRCLRSIPPSASHAVVLQDDAIVARGFLEVVPRIVEALPDHPVSLFYPARVMRSERVARRALAEGRRYFALLACDFVPVVGMIWPVRKAEHLLRFSEKESPPGMPDPRSDDAVVGYWMRRTSQTVYATMPSLVEHPDDAPSVKGDGRNPSYGRDRARSALCFHSEDARSLSFSLS